MEVFIGIIVGGLIVFLFTLSKPSSKEMSKKEMNKVYDEIDKKKKKKTERKSIKQKRLEKLIEDDSQLKAIDKKIKDLDKQARVQSSEYDELLRKMGI